MSREVTDKQKEYIELLAIDCDFQRSQRNKWISLEIGREIKFLDELTTLEASKCITELIKIKESKWQKNH